MNVMPFVLSGTTLCPADLSGALASQSKVGASSYGRRAANLRVDQQLSDSVREILAA